MYKKYTKMLNGFTLAELLIVVAIIGVMVMVSIPVFTHKLEASREAMDASNVSAVYTLAMADVLTNSFDTTSTYTREKGDYVGYYDTKNGIIVQEKTDNCMGKAAVAGFQGTEPDFPESAQYEGIGEGHYFKVTASPLSADNKNGTVTVEMEKSTAGS